MFPAGCTDPSSATTIPAAPDSRDQCGSVDRTREERGLGENLGSPALRRDDGDAGDTGRGRHCRYADR